MNEIKGSACCSDECPRRQSCAEWYGNKPKDGTYQLIAWYTFGGGTIDANGIHETWRTCGEKGNWRKYRPDFVVMCSECKHSYFVRSCSKYECKKGCGTLKYANDFCSRGERKERS